MKYTRWYRWLVLLGELLILGLCLAIPALAQGTTTVSISPVSQNVPQQQVFTVDIVVKPEVAIAGVQFDLTFDRAAVTVNSVQEGNLLKQNGASTFFQAGTINNNAGNVTGVAGAITTPGQTVSSLGTFAIITFTSGTTNGTSSLILSNVIVGDKDANAVPIQVNGATITIGVTVQPGDANGDGTINALDITKVERIIARLDSQTPGADADQDGQMNSSDITKVERIIAGLD